jgi:hypothetical protein
LINGPEHHGAGRAGQERCGDEERRNQKKKTDFLTLSVVSVRGFKS